MREWQLIIWAQSGKTLDGKVTMQIRRWLPAVSLVSFGGILLFISMLSAMGPKFVWAQSTNDAEVVVEKEAANDRVEEEEEVADDGERVDYYLPYPGILPDHPLYWLKMVRDRISLWLTRTPTQRVDKLLLFADKRIGAARALWEGNQIDLAVTTATKAEKYMEQVVGELERFSGEIENEAMLVEQVERATAKHEELLTIMLQRADDASAKIIREALELVGNAKERLEVFKEQRGLGGAEEGETMIDEGAPSTSSGQDDVGEAMEASEEGRGVPVELQGTL